jgi:ATP-dependent DNA helicase RecQ
LGPRKLTQVLNRVADAEAIERRGDEVIVTGDVDPAELMAAVEADEAARKEMDASRREMMRSYAEARSCRRQMLLTYFGQHHEGGCGNCDTCADVEAAAAASTGGAPADVAPFPPGTGVEHETWGAGQVIRADGDTLTVLFDAGGYRNLSLAVVVERGLLKTA